MKESAFILCADDFGLHAGVSAGILSLVAQGRLSAVSCMVNMPDFAKQAGALSAYKDQVHIGLHINLTEGNFLSATKQSCVSLPKLLLQTHLNLIDSAHIAAEIDAQWHAFTEHFGFSPDFIDGHQHVHQLPGIRDLVITLYQRHYQDSPLYLRSTYPPVPGQSFSWKGQALANLGGRALHRRLTHLHIPHNDFFAGVYQFTQAVNYRAMFREWLAKAPPATLIMCHPGNRGSCQDKLANSRALELAYFKSDAFLEDCQAAHKSLVTGRPRNAMK